MAFTLVKGQSMPEAWRTCLQLKTRCTSNSGIRIWWQIQIILDSPSLWVILFLSTNRSLAESSRVHCGLYIVQIYFNSFILTISSSAGDEATFSRQTLVPLLQSTGYLLLTIRRWRWTFWASHIMLGRVVEVVDQHEIDRVLELI